MSVTANSTVGAYTVVASVGGVATTADFPLTNSVGPQPQSRPTLGLLKTQ
ncbi:hypothetical protein [Pseudovibrio sp. Tun.PSC04-5.I4]